MEVPAILCLPCPPRQHPHPCLQLQTGTSRWPRTGPVSTTSALWGSCGMGESWGTYPRYVMSHSTEVSLQGSVITQHPGWHHGSPVPPGLLPGCRS